MKSKNKKKIRIVFIIILALAIFLLPGFYSGLKTVTYELKSEKISSAVRLALVSDLHSCRYGKNQEELLNAIESGSPDAILITGDFFDDKIPSENCEFFLKGVSGKYPVFYVTGNHEYWSEQDKFDTDMQMLKDYGITRLSGDIRIIEIRGNKIAVCGIDDPYGFYKNEANTFTDELESVTENLPKDIYSILMTHRPEYFESYQNRGFDLVVSGHAHGGQWRIPGLINGLYAPNQGLFPKYAGGLYDRLPTKMIVSRGLARESTRIPRIYNRPELVFIDLIQ